MTEVNDLHARLASLERRLQELEDDRAIRELLSRYGYNADQGHDEAWVDLFTTDGVLDVAAIDAAAGLRHAAGNAREEEPTDVLDRHEGRTQLRAFIANASSHKAIEGRSLHIMGDNLVTRISADEATAESYNITLVREGSRIVLFNASINRWRLVRRDGEWKIKECLRRRPGAPGFDGLLTSVG